MSTILAILSSITPYQYFSLKSFRIFILILIQIKNTMIISSEEMKKIRIEIMMKKMRMMI